MSPLTIDRIWQGLLDTLTMVSASALIAALAGIPLALILVPCGQWRPSEPARCSC